MNDEELKKRLDKLEREVLILRGCINDMQTLYKQAGQDIGYAFKEIQRIKTGVA